MNFEIMVNTIANWDTFAVVMVSSIIAAYILVTMTLIVGFNKRMHVVAFYVAISIVTVIPTVHFIAKKIHKSPLVCWYQTP